MGSTCGYLGFTVGSPLGHLRVTVGLTWGHFEVTVGSSLCHRGSPWGSGGCDVCYCYDHQRKYGDGGGGYALLGSTTRVVATLPN